MVVVVASPDQELCWDAQKAQNANIISLEPYQVKCIEAT